MLLEKVNPFRFELVKVHHIMVSAKSYGALAAHLRETLPKM